MDTRPVSGILGQDEAWNRRGLGRYGQRSANVGGAPVEFPAATIARKAAALTYCILGTGALPSAALQIALERVEDALVTTKTADS